MPPKLASLLKDDLIKDLPFSNYSSASGAACKHPTCANALIVKLIAAPTSRVYSSTSLLFFTSSPSPLWKPLMNGKLDAVSSPIHFNSKQPTNIGFQNLSLMLCHK